MIIKFCPKCGFSVLIKEINFETLDCYFYCVKCGYLELICD